MMKLKNYNNIAYLNLEFDDFETFKEAASRWSLEFKQLDSGRFFGDIAVLDSPEVQIGTTKLNRKLDQRGIAPAGYKTFIIPKLDISGQYIWRGHEVSENELLIQPKTREFSSISNPGWGIYTVSIAEDLVLSILEKIDTVETNGIDSSIEVVKLPSKIMNLLCKQLDFVFNLAKQNPSNIEKKAFQQIFFEEIPFMILKSLISSAYPVPTPSSWVRDIAFKKAIDYLNTCTTEMPTISELCLISGSSERTLQYAFKEKYGFGPKEYIRKRLLNQVQQELLFADPNKIKVKDIAHRYGFLHLGHFSSSYKSIFGELPSATLYK